MRSRITALVAAFSLLVPAMALAATSPSTDLGTPQVDDGARYSVSPAHGGPRTRYVATLSNEGPYTIEYGNPYSIARRTSDGWRRLSQGRCAVTMEARLLQPGMSASQRVGRLRDDCSYRRLKPGTYRVSKRITIQGNGVEPNRNKVVRARFHVMAP